MSEAAVKEQEWKPSGNPWLSALPTIFAAFMFVLDETIANVALPHMAGTFSASHDESLWILTSYLVASGIMIPAVDWFSKLLGRRAFFIISILVFTFASFLCAMSTSMTMIVCARALQGLGGGGLLPISQSVLLESFPKEQRGKSMAVFGLVIVVAPILGPVIGGWITDNFDWTWVFLINIPIGILTAYLAYELLQEPPYAKKQKGDVPIDGKGFLFLAVWLVTLQVVLDKGNNLDWFNSVFIKRLAIISVISMILFFWSQFTNKKSLLDLTVFKDKNFTIGTIIQCVIQAVLLASVALLPQFLQMLMGYSAFLSGLSIMPRGIGAFTSMILCGILSQKIDNRILAVFGLTLVGIASFWLGNLNLQISSVNIALPNFVFGLGMSFAFIPLISLSVITLKNNQMTNASGLQNLLKNVAGAIGTSVAGTFVSRFSQIHQHYMVDNLSSLNTVFQVKVNAMMSAFSSITDSVTAQAMANYSMYGDMLKQSTLWGYMETFRVYCAATFVIIPLILFIKHSGLVKKKPEVPLEDF